MHMYREWNLLQGIGACDDVDWQVLWSAIGKMEKQEGAVRKEWTALKAGEWISQLHGQAEKGKQLS